jgi:uncharacterized protein (TIGR02284 family)
MDLTEAPGTSRSAGDALRATIEGLVAACADGARTYANASQRVRDDRLREYCERRRHRRVEQARELDQSLRAIGERPIHRGAIMGALERVATRLAQLIDGRHDRDVLDACEHVDSVAADAYARALETKMPEAMRAALADHRAEIAADGALAHTWRLQL